MNHRKDYSASPQRTIPPAKAIIFIQRQIDKGYELLASRPLTQASHNAWKNTTREILIKAFGSQSENIDTVLLRKQSGSVPMNAGDGWWENYRVKQLNEQLELLESTKEQLQIELELETELLDNEIFENINSIPINLRLLKELIADHFNNEDLRGLCFKLAVKYEDLGESIQNSSKSRSLIEHMQQHGRLGELLIAVVKERPRVDWSKCV
ncbi:MAG: hypothetical protein IPJ90_17975 [Anaerolineaceae bacterium]|nr:hypothetical protein [Anaerolineaceae bacterium]